VGRVFVAGTCKLGFLNNSETQFISFVAPSGLGSSANYTLPVAPSINGQVLTSLTDGTMSWQSVGAGTVTSVGKSGNNLIFSVDPIVATGTIGLNPVLTGITSAVIGGHTYSSTGIAATSGYLIATSLGTIQLQTLSGSWVEIVSDLKITPVGGATKSIQLFDLGGKSVTFKAPNAMATLSTTYTLPTDYPTVDGYHLSSTTLGVMSWTADTGASSAVKFLVQTTADLTSVPNAQAMGQLATGIVKNTTTSGAQTIAVAGTDYYAPASPNTTYALTISNVGGTPNASLYLANTTNAPASAPGGGAFYVQGGALLFIGGSGTVTTIAPA
jgi:hypothetical protein